jgi:hypothetical protein
MTGCSGHGAVSDLERVLTVQRDRAATIRAELEQRNDWLHATKRRLLTADAALAATTARTHARSQNNFATAAETESHGKLIRLRSIRLHEYTELLTRYRSQTRLVESLEAESRLRASLQPALHEAEERARTATHISPATASRIPNLSR